MSPRRAPILFLAAASLAHAEPAPRRLLLDAELRAQPVELVSIDGRTIVYVDDAGRRRQGSVAGFVALLPADDQPSAHNPLGVLELTDGQRFPGERASTGGPDDAIVWRHPRFGRIAVPIDRVARAALHPDGKSLFSSRPASSSRDRVLLSNGDLVSGFLVSLADPVEIQTDAGLVAIPTERVVAVDTTNEPEALRGLVVWLDDGAVAVLSSMDADGPAAVSLRLPQGESARYAIGSVRSIAFDAGRILPLASLTPSSQSPLGERRRFDPVSPVATAAPAPLGAANLEFPGPMRATWSLPPGSRRLAARASLPLRALPWGDCELVVSIDGVELVRERLHMNRPAVDFSIPASGRELAIAVEPGVFGAVSDFVLLERPILLLDAPDSRSR